MKTIIRMVLFAGFILPAMAQNTTETVLESIRRNNMTLKALQQNAEAEKVGNRTGLSPDNPEVEFGYLWGTPAGTDNRKDLSVTQSFDFPLAYRYKSQLSKAQNARVDLLYQQQERQVLYTARLYCVEATYRALLDCELTRRTEEAEKLAAAYETLFDKGEVSILEYNKAKLYYLGIRKEAKINQVEKVALLAELQRMNGNEVLTVNPEEYDRFILPESFDEWFAVMSELNPDLRAAEEDIVISRKQEQLTRALNLPKLTAGYVSERMPGITQQGVLVGVSIPLWQGHNTVKYRKAKTLALEAAQDDIEFRLHSNLRSLYEKASRLLSLLTVYKSLLDLSNNCELLQKAFEQGQLSLVDYLQELSNYYSIVDQYLTAERDYHLATAELQAQQTLQ